MTTYRSSLLLQRDPLRILFATETEDGGAIAREVPLTPDEARGLGLALVAEAARAQVAAEQAAAEVEALSALYKRGESVQAANAAPEIQ